MSFALIGNEGVDFLFRECRMRWTVVSVAVWCCFKRHTSLGNWSCSCTPYFLANMLLSLLNAVHYDDDLHVRSSRRCTVHKTKSASVGIPSGLLMNSLNSGPIHGRTVSTMLVLTAKPLWCLSISCRRTVCVLHPSACCMCQKKMGKGQKNFEIFNF